MSSEDPQEAIRRELQALFNYNPPPFHKVEDPLEYRPPFTFFDRHIDSRLSLQRVVLLPSFSREVAEVVDQEIQALEKGGIQLPLIKYDYDDPDDRCVLHVKSLRPTASSWDHLRDAASVARYYAKISFLYCCPIGSTLGLHPRSHTWLSIFNFSKAGAEPDEGRSAMTHQYHLQISRDFDTGQMSVAKGIWKCLDDETRANVSELFKHFRTLATYQFFAAKEEYDHLLGRMSALGSELSFAPLSSSVSAVQPEDISVPVMVDAPAALLRLPQEPSILTAQPQEQDHREQVSQAVTVQRSGCDQGDSSDINVFIQHAWTQSVIDDTTFIIFFCGKYERIGIRHRKSRTLFISDLIDVQGCRDPAYGKIQAGIYLLIIKDAMDRVSQLRKLGANPVHWAGKPLNDIEGGKKEVPRRKTRSMSASIEKEKAHFLEQCAKRDLALVHIRHAPFNSPSPSAFMRSIHPPASGLKKHRSKSSASARQYQAHEYVELVLTPGHESGATGQIHKTILRLTLSDGTTLCRPVIVKMAFLQYQRERLRHEHVVYSYMDTKRVKCVVTTFGFFDDVENQSSILIMADAGISLYDRELKRKPGAKFVENVSVTREEREAFKRALTEIHNAGVRHYDIRPMNLMVDGDGNTTIIDFDMAKIGAGKHSRKREYDDLCLLLGGTYIPPNQFPSPATTQSIQSDSKVLRDISA